MRGNSSEFAPRTETTETPNVDARSVVISRQRCPLAGRAQRDAARALATSSIASAPAAVSRDNSYTGGDARSGDAPCNAGKKRRQVLTHDDRRAGDDHRDDGNQQTVLDRRGAILLTQ